MTDCRNLDLLAELLTQIPPDLRGQAMLQVASFRPHPFDESSSFVGELRSLFADSWEALFHSAVPFKQLRDLLATPISAANLIPFMVLNQAIDRAEIVDGLQEILEHLLALVEDLQAPTQSALFGAADKQPCSPTPKQQSEFSGQSVQDLNELVSADCQFSTIYADPPWQYDNTVSRGAAANHYQTMSVEQICELPVDKITNENAHLHLWTTNAFLRDAFDVIEAWGFEFKSCFVWVKNEIGMGNYWRVSHEFLLLGVKGRLTFESKDQRSWIASSRTAHSRKPAKVRQLIEKVSPGPYLELFGREALPESAWTVFGNQVEDRLF